ncbi:MAG: hypothetical protein RR692_06200 [Raoultibacter sp.]
MLAKNHATSLSSPSKKAHARTLLSAPIILLCFLVFSCTFLLVPQTAHAANQRTTSLDFTSTNVVLRDGTSFNPQTTSITTAQTLEGWGWNAESKTLLVDGLNLSVVGGIDDAAITLAEGTIQVEGAGGAIEFKPDTALPATIAGIYSTGTLAFTGSETLSVSITREKKSIGIYTEAGSLSFNGPTIQTSGADMGIGTNTDFDIAVAAGSITAKGLVYGLACGGSLSVDAATVTAATSSANPNLATYAIFAHKDVTLRNNAIVSATSAMNTLAVQGALTIEDSNLTASATRVGVQVGGPTTATNSTLDLLAVNTALSSNGPTAFTNTTAKISTTGGYLGSAFRCFNRLLVDGGDITLSAAGDRSSGITIAPPDKTPIDRAFIMKAGKFVAQGKSAGIVFVATGENQTPSPASIEGNLAVLEGGEIFRTTHFGTELDTYWSYSNTGGISFEKSTLVGASPTVIIGEAAPVPPEPKPEPKPEPVAPIPTPTPPATTDPTPPVPPTPPSKSATKLPAAGDNTAKPAAALYLTLLGGAALLTATACSRRHNFKQS